MNSPHIEIYTKFGCGYCTRAKQLLDSKGASYEEFDVTFGGDKKQEMMERVPQARTVPQIFIDGMHVGGCDDLMNLDHTGKLDMLLGR
jgi:glutaredoxin 3